MAYRVHREKKDFKNSIISRREIFYTTTMIHRETQVQNLNRP